MLLAEGHPHAHKYPLSKLWIEAEITEERINRKTITETTLMHACIVAVLSPKGEGAKHYQKLVKELSDGH